LTNVYVKSGLFDAKDGRIPLIITNKRRYDVEIRKGKIQARVEIVNLVVEESINTVVSTLKAKGINAKKISQIVDLNKTITDTQKKRLEELVDKYDHIFSEGNDDFGFNDNKPFVIIICRHR
jgi:hypothetical protein